MKIAFLTSEYPHPKTGHSGGIGTSIKNLARGLEQQGHEVSVLVYSQMEDEVFQENGITFYKIKNVQFIGFSRFFTQKKIESLINNLIEAQKIEIIEAPDWTGITSFIQPKCPVVIKLHGSDTYFCNLENRPVKWRNRFHEKRALKKATALLSVSKYTGEITKKIFDLESKITIIPNGVDLAAFVTQNNISPEKTPSILYFGTLIRKKGSLELPLIFNEVFKKLPNVKLIIVGKDGSDIISKNNSTWLIMQNLFSDEALKQVRYIGSVPYNEICNLIHTSTVCVFPTFAEALPVSWIEAMAMQKPIVASNIGWASEIIVDSIDGFLVHPKDHTIYANKIVEIIENFDLQIQVGKAAREKVETQFSIEVVAKRSVEFYQSIVK